MAQLVVRNIDEDVKAKLKRRADVHGHSMEEEVRHILRAATLGDPGTDHGLGTRIAARFRDLTAPAPVIEEFRGEMRPADFE